MSVKQRFNWLDNMRVDKPHLKSIDDSVIFDFKSLLQGFVSDTPYILRGFDVNNPGAAINGNASNIQVVVDASTIWMPSETDGSFLRVPAGTTNETLSSANTKVTGSFTAGAINYVSVKFARATDASTNDLVAFWDVDAEVEFTKTVPLGLVLNYQFVINTSGFGTNSPIAVITTDASNNVLSILNAKNSMFRLGKGGTSPNSSYNWAYSLPTENSLLLSSVGGPNPYAGGDWEIKDWKSWMDAVMTEIKAMKGSAYWYSPGSSLVPSANISDLFWDTAASTMTGVGRFKHSEGTPGQLIWTSTMKIRSMFGPLTLEIAASSVNLADLDVAYISLVRNEDFQASNTFTFTNGSPTITATATISGIVAGDWIKHEAANFSAWQKVQSVVGTTITLTANYTGSNAIGKALRTVGTYTVSSAAPASVPVSSNTYWLAKRDDNAVANSTLDTPGNSGLQRTSNVSTGKTTVAHNLVEGNVISITGASDATFDGVYVIESVPSSTTFTFRNQGPDVGAATAGNGTVAVRATIFLRYHGAIQQGEEINIDDNVTTDTLTYIGATSATDSVPDYADYSSGSLALPSYNTSAGENLTTRLAKVTAMLADNKQDFNIQIDPGAITWDGTTLGVIGAQLSIPGTTVGATPVTINTFSGALVANSCLYVDISRSSTSALTLASSTLAALTPSQQRLVVARNLGGNIHMRAS